jgi:phospholipid/cholesterol/gamma-HCH transport system permease protein
MKAIHHVGKYTMLMGRVLSMPDRWSLFFRNLREEVYKLGVGSLPIIFIISIFMGAVITIQLVINIESPLMPDYAVGLSTRDTLLLEFSSTIACLILAGKVGSSIASEIGTMRVTEQIDALEIMGVNSANYLILPKIVGLILFMPVITIVSMFTGICGGILVATFTDIISLNKFVFGLQSYFIEFYVYYPIYKSLMFAFIISSVSSYWGYYTKGGALDVSKSSTLAVVSSSVIILFFDVVFTKLFLQ